MTAQEVDGSQVVECRGCGQKMRAAPLDRVRCPRCATERAPIPVGQVLMPCPMCRVRRVETAAKVNVLRGFLLWSRMGSRTAIGCASCVRRAARQEMVGNLLLGWWCFPWGLLTPFYVVQNAWASFAKPDLAKVDFAMRQLGMSLSEIQVGTDGFTGAERSFLQAICRIVGQVAATAGEGTPEWAAAIEVVREFSDGKLGARGAAAWLTEHSREEADADGRPHEDRVTDYRDRLMLLRLAAEVAAADGGIDDIEQQALSMLSVRLRLSPLEFNAVLDAVRRMSAPGQSFEQNQDEDLEVLGLKSGATTSEIRSAYREAMLEHHPDLAPESERAAATEAAARINLAYDRLIGAR